MNNFPYLLLMLSSVANRHISVRYFILSCLSCHANRTKWKQEFCYIYAARLVRSFKFNVLRWTAFFFLLHLSLFISWQCKCKRNNANITISNQSAYFVYFMGDLCVRFVCLFVTVLAYYSSCICYYYYTIGCCFCSMRLHIFALFSWISFENGMKRNENAKNSNLECVKYLSFSCSLKILPFVIGLRVRHPATVLAFEAIRTKA